MYGFVKMMHDAGCDISGYLTSDAITQAEYDVIMGGQDGTI
ncbi:XkdX family protein [Latilactobacillus sakei]